MQMINAGCHAERKGRGWAGVGWYHGGGVGQIYVNQCHCARPDKWTAPQPITAPRGKLGGQGFYIFALWFFLFNVIMSSNANFHSALLQQIEAHAATKSPGQIFASLFIDSDSIFHNTQFVESLSFVVARSSAENYLVRFNFRINYYFSSEIFLLSRDRGARRRRMSTWCGCVGVHTQRLLWFNTEDWTFKCAATMFIYTFRYNYSSSAPKMLGLCGHKDAHEITVCWGHGKVIFLRIAK